MRSNHHVSCAILTALLVALSGTSAVAAFQSPKLRSHSSSGPSLEFGASSHLFSSAPSGAVQESSVNSSAPGKKNGPIQTLDSVSDFLDYLDNAPTNSLSVVEFYGKNCPLCKRVALKFKKIANTYSKQGVQFAQMEHPANKPVMDALGIRNFPFLHVYRNGQCVAAHGTESDTAFEGIVKDTIQRELDMTEEDWKGFLTAFAGPIQQGTARIDQLRAIRAQETQ